MSDDKQPASTSTAPPVSVLGGLARVGAVISALVILKWTVNYFRDDSPNAVGLDEMVTTLGTVEVTARLVKVPKELPDDEQEPYASLFQYDVLRVYRGGTEHKRIFVAHYNPTMPRAGAADNKVREPGGKVTEFHEGDRHRLALEAPLEKFYQGKLIDDFPEIKEKGLIYWAVWTNPVN